ncbi:insulinase family protein, partial [Candidatus Roizmanbacteria bacterium]|nr:insulinase family protein [Candidatus Roizmanbacteria bacterium]
MLPEIFTFKNGLKIILIDTKAFPTMTVILLFGAGSRYENKQNNGIAHFLEHMVFKGSKKYPDFFTISSVLEGLGATHNAFTGKDHTGFWVKSPTEHFEKVIDVVGDIIQHPLLADAEIEREKGVIVQEMNMYEDQPMRKVGQYFEQLLYQEDPLGMDIIGTKETVTKFQRTNFIDYMQQFYRPNNAVLVLAGGLGFSDNKASAMQSYSSVNNNEAMKQWSNYYLDIIKEKFTKWSGLRQGYGGRGGLI